MRFIVDWDKSVTKEFLDDLAKKTKSFPGVVKVTVQDDPKDAIAAFIDALKGSVKK